MGKDTCEMALNQSRINYISKYADAIIDSTRGTTLFPSVMMAQALIESSDRNGVAGNSSLAKNYNNHFGIKADKSWTGDKVAFNTGEVLNGQYVTIKDYFRAYPTWLSGFKDRVKFLQKNSRYTRHGVFAAATPEEQAQALQRAGYATDPKYADTIIRIIKAYNLKDLDKKKESEASC